MGSAMRFEYHDKRIAGILTVIPKNCKTFDEEMENYQADRRRSQRLKIVMGYDRHHIAETGVTASDLAYFGIERLLSSGQLLKGDIGALIVVTQSPDFIMPPTSNILQGRLGLGQDVFCLDINQGCAGFLIGLMQAFSLLNQIAEDKKVVLVNADVLSPKVSKHDRNSYPLVGDAASITVVEQSMVPMEIVGEIRMDGTRYDALIIPAGGARMPSTPETAVLHEDAEGNRRALDHLFMKGGDVFNFVQTEVPPLIMEVLAREHLKKDDIDWYLFHQPNKFMVDKLAEAINVPYEKVPSNIVTHFGNASGVTIPTNICYNVGKRMKKEVFKVCLSGFGIGLTWGAMVLDMGRMSFCDIVEF